MATIRVTHRQRFTVIDQRTINDARMSFKALGLLTWLLDKPDNWTVDSTRIANGRDKDGRDSVRSALQELEQLGYLRREKIHSENGQWISVANVYEQPAQAKPTQATPVPEMPSQVPPAQTEETAAQTSDGKPYVGKAVDLRISTNNQVLKNKDSSASATADASKVKRTNQIEAEQLAKETWAARQVKPIGGDKPFLEWRKRIEEALDAGADADLIRQAAHGAGTNRGTWDFALGKAHEARLPAHTNGRLSKQEQGMADLDVLLPEDEMGEVSR